MPTRGDGGKCPAFVTYPTNMIISDPEKYELALEGDFYRAAPKDKVDSNEVDVRHTHKSARKVLHHATMLAFVALVYFVVRNYIGTSTSIIQIQEDSSLGLDLANTLLDTSKTESLFLYVRRGE